MAQYDLTSNPPEISVIVAVLNSSKTISRCLDSIVFQSYPYTEVIVMDGGSTDGSATIIRSYQEKITYFESAPDKGIYHAWNKAIKQSHGEWMCFLGADDFFWDTKVLSEISPHLEDAWSKKIRVVYGQVAKIDSSGKHKKMIGKPWHKIRWLMPHGMPFNLPHPGLMHHRSLFEEKGLFDENFRIAGDYEFLLRELKDGNAYFVDGLCTVGSAIGGLADASRLETNREVNRARRKNGLTGFSLIWAAVYFRAWVRKFCHDLFIKERR